MPTKAATYIFSLRQHVGYRVVFLGAIFFMSVVFESANVEAHICGRKSMHFLNAQHVNLLIAHPAPGKSSTVL